jgi:anti-sigma factor RsiW
MTKPTCINPNEIEDGDLMAYLHGDAPPQVIEHIARCAFCAAQVEQLRMVDAQLLIAFYRDACPRPEVLADFVLNRLPAANRLRVAAHVRGCSACSEEVAAVRDLADEEPPSLLARLQESLALALIARPAAPSAAPARGRGWPCRYEAGDLVVTLSVQVGNLAGRVRRRTALSDTDYSGQAWLLGKETAAEEQVLRSQIDERGRFQFAAPAAGSYALLVQVGGQNVALESIRVG